MKNNNKNWIIQTRKKKAKTNQWAARMSIKLYFLGSLFGCFLLPSYGIGQNSITCKFKFTNNTTEDLRMVGAHHANDYEIEQDLPMYLRKGETYTLEYKVTDLYGMEKIWIVEEGAIPMLDYTYVDYEANHYNLTLAVQPSVRKCMIEDYGRSLDYNFMDICAGGNKNGNPLYCVDGPSTTEGLDVSLTYGFAFVHYDKTLDKWSEVLSDNTTPEESYRVANDINIRIKYKDDPSIGLSSLEEDAQVRPLETPEGDTAPQVDWKYDAVTNKLFYSTPDKNYCLGVDLNNVVVVGCGGGKVVKWLFEENGLIRWETNSDTYLCLSKRDNNTLASASCDASKTRQKWVVEASEQALISNIYLTKNTSKCLKNKDGKIDHGNPIQLYDCKPYAPSQAWTFHKNEIRLAHNQDYCLGLPGTGSTNGSPAYLYECNHSKPQIWYYDGLLQSFRSKINMNRCLDDAGSRTANGTKIQLWDCNSGGPSQQWNLDMAGAVSDPKKINYIVPVMATNLAIGTQNKGTESGTNIQLWDRLPATTTQQWYFDGTAVKMRSHMEMCLDLKNSSTSNGNNIQLWECKYNNAQQWMYDGSTMQIRYLSNPDKCMEIEKSNYANGANIQINDCNSHKKQQFLLVSDAGAGDLEVYQNKIQLSAATSPKCVTTANNKLANDNNIQVENCLENGESQSWVFNNSQIQLDRYRKKCVDVQNHNTSNGTNIRLWDCMEHDEQRWIYDGITKQFRSFLNLEKCFDAALTNGSNVKLWDCSTTTHQQWEVNGGNSVSNPTAVKNIVPVKSNYSNTRALQSANGAKAGSNIQLGEKSSTDGSIRFVFDGLQIKYGPSRDLCLTLHEASTSNGTNIELRGCSDMAAKQWIYDGNTRQIRSVADLDKCIEVETNGLYKVGSNLKLMDCDDHLRQQFEIADK